MRGEKVDLNTIRNTVKEDMENIKSRAQNFGNELKQTAQEIGERAKVMGQAAGARKDIRRGGGPSEENRQRRGTRDWNSFQSILLICCRNNSHITLWRINGIVVWWVCSLPI